jgi:hypothetical protein
VNGPGVRAEFTMIILIKIKTLPAYQRHSLSFLVLAVHPTLISIFPSRTLYP